jgi:hypothetical protein
MIFRPLDCHTRAFSQIFFTFPSTYTRLSCSSSLTPGRRGFARCFRPRHSARSFSIHDPDHSRLASAARYPAYIQHIFQPPYCFP